MSADSSQTIIYTPNQEQATVTYVDQTTGQTIDNVTLNDAYGTTSNYSPTSEINTLENEGY